MSYPEFINNLKDLNIKKKTKRPKVSPNKFYPYQIELQVKELLYNELKDYSRKLEEVATSGMTTDGVEDVVNVPGAPDDDFEKKSYDLAEKIARFNVLAFADYSDLVVGQRYFQNADRKDEIIKAWTDNFVLLCKSTNEEMRKKVAGIISDGVLNGTSIKELEKAVKNTCSDFSRNKAELIATTEVGKLNSAIARNQSESAGIQYYEWSAAMDGRTRESHAVMDGRICKWGDDNGYYVWVDKKDGGRELERRERPKNAYIGAPGTDFRCRCTALPYVPEYEDDYENEREKGEQRGVVQTQEINRKVNGSENIEGLQGIFEGKRKMLYAGEENAPDKFEFRLSREQERLTYLRRVSKDYAFVVNRKFNEKLQKDFNIYAKEGGARKINEYMRAINNKNSAVRHIPEYDNSIKRMVRYISETPIQRNMTLYRQFTIERNVAEQWEKKGVVENTAFSSFSTSRIHSDAFVSTPLKNEVVIKMIYNAKKGDKFAAPPYRIVNGNFIGYPEECEFTAKPGVIKIKSLTKEDNKFTFIVENAR